MVSNKMLKVIFVILLSLLKDVVTLQCYNCQHIYDPKTCNTTVTCNTGEICYQNSGYNSASKSLSVSMGCIENLHCTAISSGSGTLIGRGLYKRQDKGCQQCCATDYCNDNICTNQNPSGNECTDDETIDCGKLDGTLGICRDKEHAMLLCPKFCGLCDKVNGVWTDWTDWSSCSYSCGIGIQRRQRNCSNPSTDTREYHCVGLNFDDRLCRPGACNDGGWSIWGPWTSCSVTCGNGFHSRTRNCSNPRPSPFGQYCDGEPMQVSTCQHVGCKVSVDTNTNVMFKSRGFTTMGYKVDNGTVFVYSTTTINEGNGYNSTSGIFTAPLDGFYSFSVQICSPTSKSGAFGIFVNGVDIKPSPYGNDGIILCLTTNALAILKKGDSVWTQCIERICYLRGDGDKYWNTFSGFLVHE